MNHYRLKKTAESELLDILDSCGWASGIKITSDNEVTTADKPLYYLIEPFVAADIADFDGVTMYATLAMSGADRALSDDSSSYFQASYDLTLTMRENKQGVSEIVDEYIEELLQRLQDCGWQYIFVKEDMVLGTKTTAKLNQLVYTVDKILYKAMSSEDVVFPISIAQGGTGATTVEQARANLELPLSNISNASTVPYARVVAFEYTNDSPSNTMNLNSFTKTGIYVGTARPSNAPDGLNQNWALTVVNTWGSEGVQTLSCRNTGDFWIRGFSSASSMLPWQKIVTDQTVSSLVSKDTGNALKVGSDGKLFVV
jgi:hypothetical protein